MQKINKKNIKSNPYVYSYTPFYDLSKNKIKIQIAGKKRINLDEIKKYLNYHKLPPITLKKSQVEEQIFELFLNNNIRFGPKKYISSLKDYWLKKINYFTKKNQPLKFTILGFPFKIPVLLKTDRTLPDMGELLSLKRLVDILSAIKKIYSPGGEVTIITEEIFGSFNNMGDKELNNYQDFLKFLIEKLGWHKQIKLFSFSKLKEEIIDFENVFQAKINQLEQKFIMGEKNFLKKYYGAQTSLLRITNTKRFNVQIKDLMVVYNEKKSSKNKAILRLKKLIDYYTHIMLIKYLAYLELRDEFNFMEKNFPNSLMLSVSPKPYRLGIHPVDKNILRLPYHGVTIFDEKEKKFSIEYLIDLQRKNWSVEKNYFTEDKEDKPFFYVKK